MKSRFVSMLLCMVCSSAFAHGLEHSVSRGDAVVVTITHDDGRPFAFEAVEVFPPGETVPFQQGRTDALGRVAFVPDEDGPWRVRAFSDDGHGVDITVPALSTAPAGPVAAPDRGRFRIVTGVSILFGIFGVVALFYRRHPSRPAQGQR